MNYNILAPVYLDQHRHLYMETEDSLLDWGYRWSLLQREISCHKPDIVTLQEVQFSREEDIFNNDLVPCLQSQVTIMSPSREQTDGTTAASSSIAQISSGNVIPRK